MPKVVGVRFRRAGKIYYFDPGNLELSLSQDVIVETGRGLEFGAIVQDIKEVGEEEIVPPLRLVRRIATEGDYRQLEENRQKEGEALSICQDRIGKHQLEMKLVDVEYTFDHNKIIFYFTAEGRVDFRNLVRDLASVFRTRIELRQIGVRDEAKIVGGLGPCGRSLCCVTFLEDFGSVSIRMAKEQNLSLNPTKISGICGRLMCCLRYEAEHYEYARKKGCSVPRDGNGSPDGEDITGSEADIPGKPDTEVIGGEGADLKAPGRDPDKRMEEKGEQPGRNKETGKRGRRDNGGKRPGKNR